MTSFTFLRRPLLLALLLPGAYRTLAQTPGVGIGTATPHASAALDVSSTTKGLLPPRLSLAQRDAIASPAEGLTIFNTSTRALNTWDGTQWVVALTGTTPTSITFVYTAPGGVQTYTVPAGMTTLSVDMAGGAGGSNLDGTNLGGRVRATLAVTPGQVLTVVVGGAGTPNTAGYNGGGTTSGGQGGGGGASDIRTGGTALTNRVLVAGGGGGGGYFGPGGAGGGLTGASGSSGSGGGTGGLGGSQSAPGAGGAASFPGTGGNSGSGATGGSGNASRGSGGGGYFGGGSGGGTSGGGGGSSYAGSGTSAVAHTQGFQAGDGYVTLAPAPVLDGSDITGVIKNQTTPQAGASFNISGDGIIGGSVAIGTSTPGQKLTVTGGIVATTSELVRVQGAHLQWNRSSGLGETWLLNQRGIGPGGIYFGASDAVSTGTNTVVEWAHFDGSGNLGIGTAPGTGFKLDVAGNIRCVALTQTSDRRFKTNVRPLTSALASVLALRGVRYEWNTLGIRHGGTAGAGQVGLIAQEVEALYPELVSTDADGYKAVNYAQLTPVLIEALKEQQAQLEALKAEAASARAQAARATATLETFEARLRRLEAGEGQARR